MFRKLFARKSVGECGDVLVTDWAGSTQPPVFDVDQVELHRWVLSSDDVRVEMLGRSVTLDSAAELIATCFSVADEHERRAVQARELAGFVASRFASLERVLPDARVNNVAVLRAVRAA